MKFTGVTALALLTFGMLVGVPSLAQNNSDLFPRLGGTNYGSPHNYDDPKYQADLAKLDVVLLNYWPGWDVGRKVTMNQVVRNIKSTNPRARVFLYVSNNELVKPAGVYSEVEARLNQTSGWLYSTGGSGVPVPSSWDPSKYRSINNTLFGPRDSSGKNFVEWYAHWVFTQYYKPNPSIDGLFLDNVFWRPRVDGDWNRDGVKDSARSPEVGKWMREGSARHFQVMNQLMPGKMQMANVADLGEPTAPVAELQGAAHGGLMESFIGHSYSVETWGSFADALRWYRKTLSVLRAPKLLIFNQYGSRTDYKGFRYGFAFCLLDDGYYNFTDSKANYYGVPWFDEYDAKLGSAISAPPTAPWQKGVYRRDFQNGVVLLNPKGNSAVELDMGVEFRRINGAQDPTVNNGQLAGKVRLAGREAIVLLRERPSVVTPPRKPRPPGNLVVE